MLIGIIPARSGSKGLKDKNIKDLNGKPLMAYTIETALKANIFDEVMVSTDSQKYADIAIKYGAKVPFLRSYKTSGDTASTHDVIVEVINEYKKIGRTFDDLCILQPTSPLRTVDDIIGAYKLYKEKASVAVVSVCEVDHSPLWCNTLPNDYSLDGFIKNNTTRRQDIEKYYRINGAIYFVKTNEYLNDPNFYKKGSYAYIMDKRHSVDIDDEFDYNLAMACTYIEDKNQFNKYKKNIKLDTNLSNIKCDSIRNKFNKLCDFEGKVIFLDSLIDIISDYIDMNFFQNNNICKFDYDETIMKLNCVKDLIKSINCKVYFISNNNIKEYSYDYIRSILFEVYFVFEVNIKNMYNVYF